MTAKSNKMSRTSSDFRGNTGVTWEPHYP